MAHPSYPSLYNLAIRMPCRTMSKALQKSRQIIVKILKTISNKISWKKYQFITALCFENSTRNMQKKKKHGNWSNNFSLIAYFIDTDFLTLKQTNLEFQWWKLQKSHMWHLVKDSAEDCPLHTPAVQPQCQMRLAPLCPVVWK